MKRPDLAAQTFDVEAVRRNLNRAKLAGAAPPPAPPSRPDPRVDPYPEARRLLERVIALGRDKHPEKKASLAPFLEQASCLLADMQKASPPLVAATPEGERKDIATLREQLRQVIHDLEDLFEVYAKIGLR